jgi:exopolysaccharide biosynthesis polyprenyl glycosylphosphotransferase
MNNLMNFRKTVMRFIKMLIVASITFSFVQTWVSNYTSSLFSRNGNYVVIFSFVFIFSLFASLYGAFKVGIYRIHELVYSYTLSILITNFLMYLELSLIAREMVKVTPLLINVCFQFIIAFIGCVAANTVYFKLYPARELVAVFGDDYTGFKLINRMSHLPERFKIIRGLNANSTPIEDIKRLISSCDGVVICDIDKNIEKQIYAFCYAKKKRIYMLPAITDIIINHSYEIQIGDTPVIMSRNRGLTMEQRIIKRAMDVAVSLIALVITSPFMLFSALAIKLDDGGPIFFKQNRITKDGKIFNVLKFRSMIVDADKDGAKKAEVGDNRITRVGKIIRACRLDELPQLINVLRGDMSLVGPRPERIENVYEYSQAYPEFELRHKVKGGITGYAQLYGKYNTSPKDKLNMDLIYIETYSIIQDIKLLILTIKILFMKESTEGFDASANANVKSPRIEKQEGENGTK